VDAGRDEIASTAVTFLLDRIKNRDESLPPRRHLSKFQVIPRASTIGNVSAAHRST
jgi:DNA-binding LacI/PurR family transcriptional regulator